MFCHLFLYKSLNKKKMKWEEPIFIQFLKMMCVIYKLKKKYFLKDIFMRKKQYLSLPLEDDMGCSSSWCFRFLIQSSRELCVPKDNWDNASNNTATEIVTKAFGNIVLLYFVFSGRYVFLSVWTKIIQL